MVTDEESEDEVKEVESEENTPYEARVGIEKLINVKDLNSDERPSLSSIKERLETIRINNESFECCYVGIVILIFNRSYYC